MNMIAVYLEFDKKRIEENETKNGTGT